MTWGGGGTSKGYIPELLLGDFVLSRAYREADLFLLTVLAIMESMVTGQNLCALPLTLCMLVTSRSLLPAVHDNHLSSVTDLSLQFDPLAGPLTQLEECW